MQEVGLPGDEECEKGNEKGEEAEDEGRVETRRTRVGCAPASLGGCSEWYVAIAVLESRAVERRGQRKPLRSRSSELPLTLANRGCFSLEGSMGLAGSTLVKLAGSKGAKKESNRRRMLDVRWPARVQPRPFCYSKRYYKQARGFVVLCDESKVWRGETYHRAVHRGEAGAAPERVQPLAASGRFGDNTLHWKACSAPTQL